MFLLFHYYGSILLTSFGIKYHSPILFHRRSYLDNRHNIMNSCGITEVWKSVTKIEQ